MTTECEFCMNYEYDDEYECFVCVVDMDEDEVMRLYADKKSNCRYFSTG